ncbi:hypothetical protein HYH03_011727 [Edaphochlamys debaryana]|uniref:Uncharacterized protein n=1 Tax=Edaphochlamys debaryana TaxID=47281 RepID=A0A836BUN9_9CHLO|nr:hypothetical protein HYH03_011727 [Edaphochlamys debaryana]|eukprot:KAG2489776.1 hypothetical protein HYH03_011727 [Edaphochlamys debaryana]
MYCSARPVAGGVAAPLLSAELLDEQFPAFCQAMKAVAAALQQEREEAEEALGVGVGGAGGEGSSSEDEEPAEDEGDKPQKPLPDSHVAWERISASAVLAQQMSEYIKLAQIVFVMAPGSRFFTGATFPYIEALKAWHAAKARYMQRKV